MNYSDLIKRLINKSKYVSSVFDNSSIDTLMTEAADAIREQAVEIESLRTSRDESIRLMSEDARLAGEAKGRLEMSEAAGIVDGWKERAEKAEAALKRTQAREISLLVGR